MSTVGYSMNHVIFGLCTPGDSWSELHCRSLIAELAQRRDRENELIQRNCELAAQVAQMRDQARFFESLARGSLIFSGSVSALAMCLLLRCWLLHHHS